MTSIKHHCPSITASTKTKPSRRVGDSVSQRFIWDQLNFVHEHTKDV